MKDYLKLTIENILQIVTVLLQTIGIFLIKPDIFSAYNNSALFAGGNFYNFLLIFLTILFLYLSYTFNKKTHSAKWFGVFIVFGLLFIASFYFFNTTIEQKSVLFYAENTEAIRYIKGNTFTKEIQGCVNDLKLQNADISDLEIIKNCAAVTDVSQLYKVWPEKEISHNINLINLLYCICLSLASVTLVSGLQAIKCKRVKV
jgi:energy-coupling factor transporter transmembrane protein EcfT